MKTTPQEDRILIALTRQGIPRTVDTLSVETGIPKPSVRRVLGQLSRRYTILRTSSLGLVLCLPRLLHTSRAA